MSVIQWVWNNEVTDNLGNNPLAKVYYQFYFQKETYKRFSDFFKKKSTDIVNIASSFMIRDVFLETSYIQKTANKQILDFSTFSIACLQCTRNRVNSKLGIYRVREKHIAWVEEFVKGWDCVNNINSKILFCFLVPAKWGV